MRAYSDAREVVKEAVVNETKAYIKKNPTVCAGMTATKCQDFVRNTIVTQPDYKPLLKPLPKLVDVLAKQLVKNGVVDNEEKAQKAAKTVVTSGLSSLARGDPHMIGWDGTPFEFMGEHVSVEESCLAHCNQYLASLFPRLGPWRVQHPERAAPPSQRLVPILPAARQRPVRPRQQYV